MIYTNSETYAAICLQYDRVELENIATLLQTQFSQLSVERASTVEEAHRILKKLSYANKELALVLSDQQLTDGIGINFLIKTYEQYPHATRILFCDSFQHLNEAALLDARLYRVFVRPYHPLDFKLSITETMRLFQHRMELNERSRTLNELHRASLSLTGEINFDKLMHKLMRIMIDNADAQQACIILEDENTSQLFIHAQGRANNYETDLRVIEVNEFGPVCPSIVEYARKTKENVILTDALSDGLFATHPYIRKNLCRSILCAPLVYQSKLFGLVYLANNEKTNAFSPFSLELFRLLSAPAAIAIQNARLYAEMETKVMERTAQVIEQKQQIEKQRDEIKQKNEDILASINYARRIQEAFLPKVEDIKAVFPQSFVYYKPKDIVSGDFYWFTRRLSKVILAVADCTGHGIPGAFMTVMANTILRQIVELEGIFKPDEILYQMNLRVRNALQQHEGTSNSLDGMDMAICQIDIRRNKLQYAGANRPLLLIRRGEIMEYKPERYGIGGDQMGEYFRVFTNHTIEIEPNDTIYIFTDGYPDQFGEEMNTRFKSRRFYQLLQDYQNRELEHQKNLLDSDLRRWRGEIEQTDDILIIGLRL